MDVNKVLGRIPVGVLGARGTVGQRSVQLLDNHLQVCAAGAQHFARGSRGIDPQCRTAGRAGMDCTIRPQQV